MRKRIALCMAALVLALLGPGMALVVSRSFGLTMERERARALGEEAAIARAVALETASNRFDRYEASTLQTRYSSKEMAVYLLRDGEPITGEALPEAEKLPELLNTAARATLLDRPGERLLIAHALGDGVLLLAALDVAPVYALRRALMRGAALIVLLGSALAVVLAAWISGLLTRPLRQLSAAAARGWGSRSAGRSRGCIAATFASRAKSAKVRAFVTGLIHPCDDMETRNRVA